MADRRVFRVEIVQRGDVTTISAHGDLDIATADRVRGMFGLEEAQVPVVVLDLGDVGFMDSSGLAVILQQRREIEGRSGRFVLAVGDQPQVRRILMLSGLLPVLEVVDRPSDVQAD